MTTWLFLNSLGLCLVALVLFLTLRQIGFVLQRVGPLGARGTSAGPRVGENVAHALPELFRERERNRAVLIVFGSMSCSICEQVKKAAEDLAPIWKKDADILLIYDCDKDNPASQMRQLVPGLYLKIACGLRESLAARFVPFGISVDRFGAVAAKGLVNEISQLESLLEAERQARGKSGDDVVASPEVRA
jgi:methylamine dehydrogenase accessory protein MauD